MTYYTAPAVTSPTYCCGFQC